MTTTTTIKQPSWPVPVRLADSVNPRFQFDFDPDDYDDVDEVEELDFNDE